MLTPLRSAFLLLLFAVMATSFRAQEAAAPVTPDPWWKHAVIYEVYPRSFQDSNGDGPGDINGIASRLDYLKELGIDALWITTMYPSPQIDLGYRLATYPTKEQHY